MAGGYRCTLGHVWNPPNGSAATACPACGSTTFVVVEVEEEVFALATGADPPDPDTSEHLSRSDPALVPPDHAPTLEFAPPKPTDTPDPSFSSLVVVLPDSDGGSVAREPSSVVPFGPLGSSE